MSLSDGTRCPRVALNLPKGDKDLLVYAKVILAALTNNPRFPNLNPTLASFEDDIKAYDKAETVVATRVKGARAARDARRQTVVEVLRHYQDQVQGVAETQTSAAGAIEVIESAAMAVRKIGKRTKDPFRARNGAVPGTVLLDARAVAGVATYYWQFSLDLQSWISVPETMKASTVITGLLSARVYYFRFRAITRKGMTDYAQVVSLLVH